MNQQLTTTREKFNTLATMMGKSKKQIANALPKHISADRLMRVAMTSLQRTPDLLKCSPESFVGAVIQSAQLGLEPDGVLGQAYLIPRWNSGKGVHEVSFQIGYQGLIDLAMRSDTISHVIPRVVYKGESFKHGVSFGDGKGTFLNHLPEDDPGEEIRGVYCVLVFKDGNWTYEYMSFKQIESHRSAFSKVSKGGPWVDNWESMAKKTVIIKVLKYAPKSIELSKAINLDEMADANVDQGMDANLVDINLTNVESIAPDKSGALDKIVDSTQKTVSKPKPRKRGRPKAKPKPEPVKENPPDPVKEKVKADVPHGSELFGKK